MFTPVSGAQPCSNCGAPRALHPPALHRCPRCAGRADLTSLHAYCALCEAQWRQDRAAAVVEARRLVPPGRLTQDFIILDTETTGLGDDAEIVQIGLLRSDSITLLDTLVRPTTSIPREATRIHHITDAMVASAPTYTDIEPRIRALIEGKTVLIYNAAFDVRILAQVAARHDLPALQPASSHCVMLQWAAYVGAWNVKRGDYRWQKLRAGNRSAIGDCVATLGLLWAMAATE